MLEGLMSVADRYAPRRRSGPADPALRQARVCYDHLAGSVGAAILDRLFALRWVRRERDTRAIAFTPAGQRAFRARFGIP